MDPCLELKKILNQIGKSGARLVAVSKLQPSEKIRTLYACGQRDFAENYVQEAIEKIDSLVDLPDICWHFIGSLQKNKVKFVVGRFQWIHSVDSISLAEKISIEAAKKNIRQKIFLQLNISQEDTKGGFSTAEFPEQLKEIQLLKNIEIVGLMTMPPIFADLEQVRPYFRELRSLASSQNLKELSMGTSSDFSIALQEGATMIRIGTILFGERPHKG
jgi:pyridoxal phosphate enzyme (YggS family)